MDEEPTTSWIRRAKFSHTVCHRIDASRLAYVPFTAIPNRVSTVKSTPGAATSENHRIAPNAVQIQKNPSRNKQRVVWYPRTPRQSFQIPSRKPDQTRRIFASAQIIYGGFMWALLLVNGFRGFPLLTLNFHMTHNFNMHPSTLQLVQNSANLPMVEKPSYGILYDALHIGGAHRIPYILFGGSLRSSKDVN